MHHPRRTRPVVGLLAAALATASLAACGAQTPTGSAGAGATASPTAPKSTVDPATAARGAEFAKLRTEMAQAMRAAGFDASNTENLHPSGSLTGVKYCLNSYLLVVSEAKAAQVSASLAGSMKAAGWKPDPGAAPGAVTLERGDWQLTVTHQSSGTDVSPATGKVRNAPLSFFQAKDTSFDCS
ncbi:hypothetical protein [Streptacidiphilus rugosus]|uniref:hypothetical protein n=1 Tax=Streptacidiphilus rugosus TaxID=405783 RepID=UPI00056058DE|nr:hypothetical protein [Streptacidiphilus rugosus]